jgi:Phage capsid family
MSDKPDKAAYSISRAIAGVIDTGVPGGTVESEYHYDAMRSQERGQFRASLGIVGGKHLIAPLGGLGKASRQLTVAGSDWTGSQPLETPGVLAWSTVLRSGAQVLGPLSDNLVAWHTENLPASQWLPEIGLVLRSNPTTQGSLLTPKRIATSVAYSRQLFLQSSIAVDEYVTRSIGRALSAKLDAACLYGVGGVEPTGILATPGVNVVAFGAPGPGVSWAGITEMRRVCLDRDIFPDSYALISSPNNEAALSLDEAWTTSGPSALHSLRYPSYFSKEVFDDRIFTGCFSYLVAGLWGGTAAQPGLDLIVDAFTGAMNSQVIITASLFCDCAITWPAAFAFSQPAPIILATRKSNKISIK